MSLAEVEELVFERVVDFGTGVMAEVPLVGFLEAIRKWPRLEAEDALGFGDDSGDGGQVEKLAEVEVGAHRVAAGAEDAFAGQSDHAGFLAADFDEGLDNFGLGQGAGVSDIEGLA